MVARLHHRSWHYLLLLAAGACLFLVNLGGASLWDIDEGKNSTCAHEMFRSGNYIVPTWNGLLRVDKPALLYWLQIAAYSAFGIHEFSARLPSALAALVTLLLAYELGRALFGKSTGLLTGLIAATTPMLCGAARFANPDALLHLCTVATLLVFWLGHRQPTTLWWIGLGVTSGLGMLAKGPVGLALPALVGLLFLVWDGRMRVAWDRRLGWGLLAWCLVALPWYVWVAIDTKANFLRGFFLQHNVGRFTSTMESHSGSFVYYPLVLLIGTAPWSIFVGGTLWCAVASVRRRQSGGAGPPLTPGPSPQRGEGGMTGAADLEQVGHPEVMHAPSSAYRFLLVWLATYLLFFSLAATKLPNYVLPVVVPCAVLTARFLDRWRRGRLAVPAWYWRTTLLGLFVIGVAVGGGLLVMGGAVSLDLLHNRTIPGLAAFAWVGAVPCVATLVCWTLWRRDRRNPLLACLSIAAVAMLAPMAAWGSALFNAVKAPRALVEQGDALRLHEDMRIGAWQLEHLPSLNFYVQRDVVQLSSEKELRDLLKVPLTVYVFLPAARWDACLPPTKRVGYELARHRDLYRHADVVVITNRVPESPERVARGGKGF